MLTSSDARQAFKETGIGYYDITRDDFLLLRTSIEKHLVLHKEGNHGVPMIVTPMTKQYRKKLLVEPFVVLGKAITVDAPYFIGREAITFNGDGFIGFAGWASSNNQKPFIDAFMEWLESIKHRMIGEGI